MRTDSLQVARRVLVLLSDGDDNMSRVSRSEAIAAAQNAGTVIFTVSTGAYRKGDKVLEMDPRSPERAGFAGLGERPRRIADGVALAIRQWLETAHAA